MDILIFWIRSSFFTFPVPTWFIGIYFLKRNYSKFCLIRNYIFQTKNYVDFE